MANSTLPTLVEIAPYYSFVTARMDYINSLRPKHQIEVLSISHIDDDYGCTMPWYSVLDDEGEPFAEEAMDDFNRLQEAVRLRDAESDEEKCEVLQYTVSSLWAYMEARIMATENILREYGEDILNIHSRIEWLKQSMRSHDHDPEGEAERRYFARARGDR